MARGQKNLSIRKVENALRACDGVLILAAEACGVHRHTLRKFMDKHPELYEVKVEVDEELLDVAENAVIRDLRAGEMKTVRWYMERKGKNRGYSSRIEQTGPDGAPMEFEAIERRVVDHEDPDAD